MALKQTDPSHLSVLLLFRRQFATQFALYGFVWLCTVHVYARLRLYDIDV